MTADTDIASSFNTNFVEIERFKNEANNVTPNEQNAQMSAKVFNEKEKFNSYPTRSLKSSQTLKMKSSSSIAYNKQQQNDHNLTVLSQDELNLNVKMARARPQDNERLKQFLRTNCWSSHHLIRKYLWKTLLQLSQSPLNTETTMTNIPVSNKENSHQNNGIKKNFANNELEYNKILNQILGTTREINISLPDFVNISNNSGQFNSSPDQTQSIPNSTNASSNHLNYYYLNNKGKEAIKRILCVYEYHYPHVTFSPALVSISSILLHYLQEHEVFAALCFMSSTKDHLIESKLNWETACSVFVRLLKNYCKSSYEIISKYATDQLDNIFNEWYWWIFDCLSFDYLVKIMDCFIFEGQKVLYRVSLAIVQQFSKYVKTENLKVNRDTIKQFCEKPSNIESIDKLLKSSFSIRNLKRSTIREFFQKEQNKRKLLNQVSSPGEQTNALNKIDENQISDHSPTRIFLVETSTSILSHANLCTLWSWIPQRLTVYNPIMLFTTQDHGTSINTLYNILDELEYCFLVVKTFKNEIFGAFCSCYWNERKKQKVLWFGNGETFLFSLIPEKKIFKWIGTKNQKVLANQELFVRADNTKIVVGGGGQDGFSIKSGLVEGTTGKCDTFENDPLASDSSFEIAILEVIGFEGFSK